MGSTLQKGLDFSGAGSFEESVIKLGLFDHRGAAQSLPKA